MDNLPCPFCGEQPQLGVHDEWRDFEWGQFRPYIVYCSCGAMIDNDFHTQSQALGAWNKRTLVKPHLSRYEVVP